MNLNKLKSRALLSFLLLLILNISILILSVYYEGLLKHVVPACGVSGIVISLISILLWRRYKFAENGEVTVIKYVFSFYVFSVIMLIRELLVWVIFREGSGGNRQTVCGESFVILPCPLEASCNNERFRSYILKKPKG